MAKETFHFPIQYGKSFLIGCELDGLGKLSELSKLEDSDFLQSPVVLKLLGVKNPQSLKKIALSSEFSGPVRFNGLPRALEEFKFISFTDSFECNSPESVKQIYLENVDIKFLEWPLHLEQLTMKRMSLENISRTNIARLNLKALDEDQDANMGTAEALRLTKELSYKPYLKNYHELFENFT